VLADVIEMPGSPLPTVHLEAQEDSLGTVLLNQGAFVFEGNSEPLELSLEAAFTSPSMLFSGKASLKGFLAPATCKNSRVLMSMAPLILTWLLSWMLLPLLSCGIFVVESVWVKQTEDTYIMTTSPYDDCVCDCIS
jgi:hypothetical protein